MSENLAQTLGTVDLNGIFSGVIMPVVSDTVTLKSGTDYKIGSVVGIETATGKATLVDSTQTDGTQTPHGILVGNYDATTGDVTAIVHLTGEFRSEKMIFGGSDTAENHKKELRKLGIFLK